MKPEHRKNLGKTLTTKPTRTDQSKAEETSLTRLVSQFGIGGTIPGNAASPMFGDFTELPNDLRGFIETSRSLEEAHLKLPKELRDIPIEDLLYMTPEAIVDRLKPKEAPAATPPKDETK